MEKLSVINGLRGFSILAVIYHHLFFHITMPGFQHIEIGGITLLPMSYFANGWLGVNLFFILSGFVLSYSFFKYDKDFLSASKIINFYKKRAKRLLPLYYFSTLVIIIFLSQQTTLREVLLLLSLTFNFTSDFWFPHQNIVLWSLGIEVWFCLLFPFLMLSITKYGIIKTLVWVLLFSLTIRVVGTFFMPESLETGSGNFYLNPIKDSILGRLDDFLWGIAACYVYTQKPEQLTRPKSMLILSIGFITLACWLWDYAYLGKINYHFSAFINIIFDIGAFLLILSLLIMKKSFIRWLFSNTIIQLLGAMCYSLYLWHFPILQTAIPFYSIKTLSLYFIMLFLLSCFSYRFIEFRHEPDYKKLFLFKS